MKKMMMMICLVVVLAVLAVSGTAAAADVAGWEAFVIRNSGATAPTISDDTGGGKIFQITLAGQKAGWGTNSMNSRKVGDIQSLSITRDPTVIGYGPYFNIWITDGLGGYAVLANEPSHTSEYTNYGETAYDMTWNGALKNATTWVYEVDSSQGFKLPNGTITHAAVPAGTLDPKFNFNDFADYTIATPPLHWGGTGAPDDLEASSYTAYGFNWVFGDTQANYLGGYLVLNPTLVAVALPVHNETQDTYHPTIQAAIEAAISGDVINVAAGTYRENVVLNKSVTVTGDCGDPMIAGPGENAPILDGDIDQDGTPDMGDGFTIPKGTNLSGITVEGFIIQNFGNDGRNGVGVGVISWENTSSNVTIRDNRFTNLGYNGIYVGTDSDDMQSNWLVQRNIVVGAPYAGIELTDVTDSQVLDNEITGPTAIFNDPGDAGVGIEIAARARNGEVITSDILVKGNTITGAFADGSRAGINLLSRAYKSYSAAELSGITVEDNVVSGSGTLGIYVVAESRNSGSSQIQNLAIKDNILDGNYNGIVVEQVGGGTHESLSILDNIITDFTKGGIVVKDVDSVQIEGNTISTTDHSVAPNGIQIGYVMDWTTTTGTVNDNQISGCYWAGYDPYSYPYEEEDTGSGILVIAPNSALTISGNEVQDSDVGLDIEAGSDTSIQRNDVHDNSYGFVFWNAYPTVNFNSIYENSLGGVYRTYDLTGTLDATYNWWGHASGPDHPTSWDYMESQYGPNFGAGDEISDYVLYDPWLVKMDSFVIQKAKIEVAKDKASVKGTLALDPDYGTVNISDEVTVTVGPVSSDPFTMVSKGSKWEYKGAGPITKMKIDWNKGKFEFSIANADFAGLENPVTISLQVGNDLGEQTITIAELEPILIKKAEYKASKMELKVKALNNEAGGPHTMTLYDEDDDLIDVMTYKGGNKYEYKAKGVDDPGLTVTVFSITGTSATATVKHK